MMKITADSAAIQNRRHLLHWPSTKF